jgi:branched-subunit amino acid transport protein
MTWIVVGCVGLGSFALRFVPMLLAERLRWPEPVERALRHAGTAALVFVVVQAAIGAGRGDWSRALGAAVGLLIGLVLTLRGHRPLVVIAAGLGVAWLTTALL